ncbi:MAG: Calx-beta domain-containing protein [Reyranellaceae bacterium]
MSEFEIAATARPAQRTESATSNVDHAIYVQFMDAWPRVDGAVKTVSYPIGGVFMATSLVNGLGGAAGFGENAMPRLDDSPSLQINLASVLPGGLNFFGTSYSSLYLNYNGSVTFGTALTAFSPESITASTNIPIIAPYWGDVDTRSGATSASPGGTSTGSNLVWYDLDTTNNVFTATWDDVGYFSQHLDKLNAFQLRLIAVGSDGDFDIEFRYETINWTTGDASGGDGGLFGDVAVAGYSSGDGQNFFQLPQSGVQAAMLALPTSSNVATAGLYVFSVRHGVPVVAQFSIAAASADKPEGNGAPTPFTFTITLSGDTSLSRTVSYAVAGSGPNAATPDDFPGGSFAGGTVTFTAGQTEQTITVNVLADTTVEADEGFVVTLSNPTGSAALGTDKATGTIRNDDARIGIAAASADKPEGDSGGTPFTFTVTRSGDTSVAHTVAYAVTGAGDHGASGSDFIDGFPTGIVTFASGETSKTITVDVRGDTTVESDEGFMVTLSNGSAGAVIDAPTAAGTIRDDDKAVVSIVALSATKPEGNGATSAYTFTVTLDQAATTDQTVDWTVAGSGGHAANAADFGGTLPSGTTTFLAGETSKTITIPVAGDTAIEFDEGFIVGLSNQSAGLSLGTSSANAVIQNDDKSIVSIAAQSSSKAEGNDGTTTFTFTVSLDQAGVTSQTVDWAVAGSGAHAADSADFGGALPSGTLTFTPGETSKTVTVLVAADSTMEFDEGFTVTLTNASAEVVLGTSAAPGTILNDDKSVVSIAAPFASRLEGDAGTISYEIPIVLDQAAVTTQTVAWAVTGIGDHPADAVDFGGALPSGILTFAPGETSKSVIVTVAGDTTVEFDEGAVLALSSPSAGLVLGAATSLGIILNDDLSIVSIAPVSANKPEGNGGVTLYTFAITLDQPGVVDQAVDWSVSGAGNHAADAADFGGFLPSGSVTFAAGETSKIVTVTVSGDTTVELDEGFKVALANPSSGLALGVATATGIIQNDDTTTVSIAARSAAAAEGDSGATGFDFTITLSQPAAGGETIAWSVSGTGAHATDAGDFGGQLPAGTVTFAAGQISAIVNVPVSGDTTVELDESFAVNLTLPSPGLTLGTPSAAATILNDDKSIVSIAAASAAQPEGNNATTAFDFTVSLSQAAVVGQTVDWTVTGAGAHAADATDFGGTLPSGSLSFAIGETSKTITIIVAGDATVEFDEGFAVALSNASSGLGVGMASASGTILNDDKSIVSIAATLATKAEGHSGTTAFTFTVSLDQAGTSSQSVDWTVAGAGAHAADVIDFGGSLPSGSVTFGAGQTSKTVTVLVSGDATVEPDEGFKVVLSNASAGLTVGTAAATGTILNDDATLAVAALAASKAEGDAGMAAFTFELTLNGDSTVPHSVSYAVTGSGEHPANAADFAGGVLPAGTITFGVGETTKTVVVNVAADSTSEADETFALNLSAPSAGLTIATGAATGTIVNDDAPMPTVVFDDVYVGFRGQSLHIAAADGVLFNDAGTSLVAGLLRGPSHGTLAVAADGGFDYTPTPGFAGVDSFAYRATGAAGAADRSVDIHVVPLTTGLTIELQSLSAEQQVALAYTTFFGRGADGTGFRFWVDEFNAGLPQLGAAALFPAIASSFAISAEARALYPFLDHAQGASDAEIGTFLDGVYHNLFNRSADAEGLAYWTSQVRQTLASGQFVGSILDDIVGGARNSADGQDVTTVMDKVVVNLVYVHNQERYHAPWTAADDLANATNLIHAITDAPQSVLVGVVQAYNLVIASLARVDGFGETPVSAF